MTESRFSKKILLATILVAVGISIASYVAFEAKPLDAPKAVVVDVTDSRTAIANIQKSIKGFETGNQVASESVIVFFDAQCPHCKHLWQAAQELHSNKVKFTWVPVGLLNRSSYTQGAAILNAKDPVAKMKEHEQLLNPPESFGLSATALSKEDEAVITKNNEVVLKLFTSTKRGVPFVVAKNQKTGEVWMDSGALTVDQLKTKLGIDN